MYKVCGMFASPLMGKREIIYELFCIVLVGQLSLDRTSQFNGSIKAQFADWQK
jgi:hypothetical protein